MFGNNGINYKLMFFYKKYTILSQIYYIFQIINF